MPALDQLRHLAVEERQQQRAYVAAVHVGVRHDDDAVVTQLGHVEAALFRLAAADAGAECGDQRADLGTAQHAVETRALHVQYLALQRQDRLVLAVPSALGRAAGAVTLDEEDLALRRIALLAVRQLARQRGNVEHALAACQFARLAGRLAGACRIHHFLDDAARLLRMRLEPVADGVGHRRLHHRLHLAADQLVLGLAGELRIRHFHRQHGRHALAHVVAHQGEAVLLAHPVGIFADDARQRLAKAGQMRAAVTLRNVVSETQHGLMETVVPRQRELHPYAGRGIVGD